MKATSDTRKPYRGTTRSLAIALDVGTTFSGVSYAILEPGEVPKIHGVTRFPGQEHVAGNSKIPSIVYYDKEGNLMAAGAEAEGGSVEAQAEDEEWTKAELFKLRLRPKSMKLQMNGMRLSQLPHRKTAVEVFGDFLGYLFRCTRSFIEDTHANGPALWRNVKHDIQFVLSHPNGWEGAQQTKMRRAAVRGGLIPDTDEGKARIRFVTEGEASLHACVLNGLAADVLSNPSGHGFIVADAGGGTLDISSYAIRGTSPLVIEEIAPPDCIFAGSVFVSRRARAFLEEKLRNSKYGTADSLDHIAKRFDETTKRLFRDRKDTQFIPFGSPLDKDLSVGIRGGQLKLTGEEVARLFEPSIEAAVLAIKSQVQASTGGVKSVWLVGGFASSPWLFNQLQERLSPLHITVSRPDSQTSKAVADGAIGFYCDHHVSARMSKFMYGVEYLREFDPQDQDHVARQDRMCELPSGPKLLLDAFDCILARSVRVKESTVFSRKYCTELTSLSTLSVFEVEIWCYRAGDTVPKWILRNSEEFSTLCIVRADLSPLSGSAQPKHGKNGKTYWTIVFSIEIHFGLTEFRARIKWVDNGKTRYGPASIVYNESGHRADEDDNDMQIDDDMTVSSRSDRRRSSPGSPLSRDSELSRPRSSKSTPPSDAPRVDSTYLDVPRGNSMRNAGQERGKSLSRASSSHAAPSENGSAQGSAKVSSAASDKEKMVDKGKGKEAQRSSRRSSVSGNGETMPNGAVGSTLGDTLTAIWGAARSPAISSSSSPMTRSSNQSGSALDTNATIIQPTVDSKKASPSLTPASALGTNVVQPASNSKKASPMLTPGSALGTNVVQPASNSKKASPYLTPRFALDANAVPPILESKKPSPLLTPKSASGNTFFSSLPGTFPAAHSEPQSALFTSDTGVPAFNVVTPIYEAGVADHVKKKQPNSTPKGVTSEVNLAESSKADTHDHAQAQLLGDSSWAIVDPPVAPVKTPGSSTPALAGPSPRSEAVSAKETKAMKNGKKSSPYWGAKDVAASTDLSKDSPNAGKLPSPRPAETQVVGSVTNTPAPAQDTASGSPSNDSATRVQADVPPANADLTAGATESQPAQIPENKTTTENAGAAKSVSEFQSPFGAAEPSNTAYIPELLGVDSIAGLGSSGGGDRYPTWGSGNETSWGSGNGTSWGSGLMGSSKPAASPKFGASPKLGISPKPAASPIPAAAPNPVASPKFKEATPKPQEAILQTEEPKPTESPSTLAENSSQPTVAAETTPQPEDAPSKSGESTTNPEGAPKADEATRKSDGKPLEPEIHPTGTGSTLEVPGQISRSTSGAETQATGEEEEKEENDAGGAGKGKKGKKGGGKAKKGKGKNGEKSGVTVDGQIVGKEFTDVKEIAVVKALEERNNAEGEAGGRIDVGDEKKGNVDKGGGEASSEVADVGKEANHEGGNEESQASDLWGVDGHADGGWGDTDGEAGNTGEGWGNEGWP